MHTYPPSLQAEPLLAHMRAICQDIGPRPATSQQERRAADYVEQTLRQFGVMHIQRQPFKSQNSVGWTDIPSLAAGLAASFLAIAGGRRRKLTSSLLFLGSAYTFWQSVRAIPPFFQKWIARWPSQNVIAHAPASGQARQTLYLVGHLDSQKQRFQFPPTQHQLMQAQNSLPIVLGALEGVWLLLDGLLKRARSPWWAWPSAAAYLWGLAGALRDETQPHVQGANDNATAVSLLLGIAQALKDRPLQHTDVVLLFTGCEEVGCVGMEQYLQQYTPPPDDTFWIDVEMVGAGDLCYVTRHGISYLSAYRPHPDMAALAERVARQRPQLGVTGKDMVIIEEISNLQRKKHQALCIAGYNAEGVLPNWHRLSDNLDNIESDTLNRAACYVWELMHEIDRRGGEPLR